MRKTENMQCAGVDAVFLCLSDVIYLFYCYIYDGNHRGWSFNL